MVEKKAEFIAILRIGFKIEYGTWVPTTPDRTIASPIGTYNIKPQSHFN